MPPRTDGGGHWQADLQRVEISSSPRSRQQSRKQQRGRERKRTVRKRNAVHFGEIVCCEVAKLGYVDIVGDIRDQENPNYGEIPTRHHAALSPPFP